MSNYVTFTLRTDQAAVVALCCQSAENPLVVAAGDVIVSSLRDRLERNQETERRLALHAAHEASGTAAEESVGDGGHGSRF